MAVYTHLTEAEIAGALEAYGFGPPVAVQGVPAGSINTNYLVETEHLQFFLRLNEVATEEELRYEAELLEHLRLRHVPAPRLERTLTGCPYAWLRGKPVSLFRFAPGAERTSQDATAAELAELGAALARLHLAAADFRLRRPHAFEIDSVSRWIDEIAIAGRPDLADVVPRLVAERDLLRHLRDPTLPRGVIHGDLFPDNVKWDAAGRISLLFDFEMASDGVLAYDLGVCLNSWCYDRGYDWPRARALVRGYSSIRELSGAERAGLHAELRMSALRFTVTRIRDFHLRPVPPGDRVEKDFRDYLARLDALRSMAPADLADHLFPR